MTDKTAWEELVGHVSVMPFHSGDGYSWGGDVVVSFGERAINLGAARHSNCETVKLARLLAAAPALKAERDALREALEGLADILEHDGDIDPCVSSHAPVEHYLGLARQALAISEKSE